jgi:hypothetical protein
MLGRLGSAVTADTIRGLAQAAPAWIVMLGAAIGFFSVATSYLMFGISIKNTLASDFRLPPPASAAAVAIIPIAPVLLGFHDFFFLIRLTGGILSAVDVVLLLLVYRKLHAGGREPAIPHFQIPSFVLLLIGVMVVIGGILTLF